MKYLQLRHATGVLNYGSLDILIDPMFAEKDSIPPIPNTWNDRKNPMVAFPVDLESFELPKYCLATHLHPDHFDPAAAERLPKDTVLICQKEDEEGFMDMGFTNLMPIEDELSLEGLHITKVEGQHGHGQTASAMGTSSGYILKSENEPTLYITGDTIFYDGIENTLNSHKPEVIIAFAGCAQFSDDFLDPGPITLAPEHLQSIHEQSPNAKIICTHMDAINHCKTTREDLKDYVEMHIEAKEQFIIPDDGEAVTL